MTTAAPISETLDTGDARGSRPGIVQLVAKGALLAAIVATSVFALCVLVPDGNTYAGASLLKHAALRADAPRKIVLVGGSNISFGIDSNVLREATRCPVVNMGMNGYFGSKFMLAEVRDNLRPGDVVVIAWEYDNYYKSVDGTSTDLLMVTKANPEALAYLDAEQVRGVIGRYPYVAQQKIIRLIGEARYFVKDLVSGAAADDVDSGPSLGEIEGFESFAPNGDLIGHLGVEWTGERESGIDLVNTPPDQEIIPLMVDFVEDVGARGVVAMVSFTPVIDYYYTAQKREIDRLSAELQANPKLKVPRPASDFVFPPSQHFDTVYHLNAEGRAIRSRMLADDILATFGDRARCNTTTPTT